MAIFLALVAVLSFVAAVLGVRYGQAQARIAKEMQEKQGEQEREVNAWLVKHEKVALQIVRINPHLSVVEPGHNSFMGVYPTIFPEPKFREMVERYIVNVEKSGTIFTARSPTELELRSPALRETVTKAADLLDAFCKQYPDIAKSHLGRK